MPNYVNKVSNCRCVWTYIFDILQGFIPVPLSDCDHGLTLICSYMLRIPQKYSREFLPILRTFSQHFLSPSYIKFRFYVLPVRSKSACMVNSVSNTKQRWTTATAVCNRNTYHPRKDNARSASKGHIPLRYSGRRPGLRDLRPSRRPVASSNLAYHALSSSLEASLRLCDQAADQVCDLDSVMEFGFNQLHLFKTKHKQPIVQHLTFTNAVKSVKCAQASRR